MSALGRPSRREFLVSSALAGGALVVAVASPVGVPRALAQLAESSGTRFVPNAFLRIDADDRITVILAHSEMGQGIWTALPMLIAEELDADWSKIQVEHAPANPAYGSTAMGGAQLTGGSTSTWSEFDRYRRAGAVARELLLQAAAQRTGLPRAQLRTENGAVIAGEQRISYGALAGAASALGAPEPASVQLKDPASWKIIGKPTQRLDGPEKVSGRAVFGMDVRLEGLLTALVAHAPVFGGRVRSFDAAAASKVPGVRKVVQVPSGVAVIADHFWAAKLGRDALVVDWELGPGAALQSAKLRAEWQALAPKPGAIAAAKGDAAAALATAPRTLEAEYAVPYLPHAPMEPLNCTVRLSPGKCEIFTGTQFQSADQALAAQITGLAPAQVEITTTFLGGACGRRAMPVSDVLAEAVHVAKAAGGTAPVKTVWTREDDVRGGYYRSAFVHHLRVGIAESGAPSAWRHVLIGQSIAAGTPLEPVMVRNGVDGTSVEGASDSPYLGAISDHSVELHSPRTAIPVLWWRSVAHSHTAFAIESLIDELAHAAQRDPLEYRRSLLAAHPRHLGALNLAAERAGWGSPLPAGRARGIAVHESFGSFVAEVAEVSVEGGAIRVHRVVCAVDCGIAVNPAGIAAQLESAVAYALSAALYGALELREGRVQQSNFHDFRVLRLPEMPRVEVHLVQSSEKPGGIGEVGVPPAAPAVANAVFALTGKRLRELPLRLPA